MAANDDLMRILGFTEDELALNRVGDVSVGQIEQLKQYTEKANNHTLGWVFFGMLFFGCFFCTSLFISDRSRPDSNVSNQRKSNPIVFLVIGVVVASVGVFFVTTTSKRTSQDRAELIVMKIDASIRLKRSRGRHGYWYYLMLERHEFTISQEIYDQLEVLRTHDGENVMYRWYFLKHTGMILSAQHLG
jgi:hypothetical protein